MRGRRETRTSDQSDSGADQRVQNANGSNNGTPDVEGARSVSNDDADDQDSTTEHPDSGSSHSPYGHTDDEAKEWEAILADNERLRKSKQHADRKITQLGQDNARLRQSNTTDDSGPSSLEDRFDRLEGLVARALTSQADNGNGSDDDGDLQSAYEDYGIDFSQDDRNNGKGDPRFSALENVVLGMYGDFKSQSEKMASFEADRAERASVRDIQSELGIPEEAAHALAEIAGPGVDVVKIVKAAELTSLPREARRIAREDRKSRRENIGHPTAGVRQNIQTDEQSMQVEVKEIAAMSDSKEKRDRIFDFFDNYPDGERMLREAIGI